MPAARTRLADPSFEPTGRQFDVIARKAQGVVAARKAQADRRFVEQLRAEVRAAVRGLDVGASASQARG
jgi:hypothetical protein